LLFFFFFSISELMFPHLRSVEIFLKFSFLFVGIEYTLLYYKVSLFSVLLLIIWCSIDFFFLIWVGFKS